MVSFGIGFGLTAIRAAGGGAVVPVNAVAPAITGTNAVGEMLTATPGTYSGSPTSRSYVWKRGGTVIPLQVGATCMVPPNAAGLTITVEETAYNAFGASAATASAATTSIARTYMASAFDTTTGLWSHCQVLKSGYSGNLVELYMDGVAKICAPTSQGLLDRADIEAWWQARSSYTGLGGKMPRVRNMYSQGTATTAHFTQSVEAYMPILDMNAWDDDGLIALSFNGYNGRDSYWDGSEPQTTALPVSVAEINTFMQVVSGTLTFKTCEHTVAMVVKGLTNVGTSASGGGQCYLAGMKATTSASTNNWGLRSGAFNWAGPYGLGVTSGTTLESPASTLRAPANKCLVAEMQTVTVTNTIDGFTPVANAVVNIRLNNDTAQQWTANTSVARTASAGSSGFLSIGRGPTGGGGTGGGTNASTATNDGESFAFYAMAYVDAPLSTGSGGGIVDNRNASYASMMKALNVRDDYTTNIVTFGASSSGGYAGNAGMGFSVRLRNLFGSKARVSTYAMTSARIAYHLVPNKTALAAQVISGKRNIAIMYMAAPDIGTNTGDSTYYTGAQTQANAVTFAQALIAAGFYKVFISTFITPGFATTSNPIGPSGCITEVGNFNTAVLNSANQTAGGYTAIDLHTALGSNVVDYTNYHYNDTSSHPRAELTHGLTASAYASAIAADVI